MAWPICQGLAGPPGALPMLFLVRFLLVVTPLCYPHHSPARAAALSYCGASPPAALQATIPLMPTLAAVLCPACPAQQAATHPPTIALHPARFVFLASLLLLMGLPVHQAHLAPTSLALVPLLPQHATRGATALRQRCPSLCHVQQAMPAQHWVPVLWVQYVLWAFTVHLEACLSLAL